MESKYRPIAISCKAKDLLDEIMKLNPGQKKFVYVSELIQKAYDEQVKGA